MSESFDLDAPDHFTAGAIGPPGQRVFYLQGRQAGRLVTLKVEKQQVHGLAEYVAGLLAKLTPSPPPAAGSLDLIEPVEPAWTAGSLGVGHDEARGRFLIVVTELVEDDEADGEEAARTPAQARFLLTGPQAAALVERARALVRAGRPICPLCSEVQTPGHFCPRSNGHKVVEPA